MFLAVKIVKFTIVLGLVLFLLSLGYVNLGGYFLGGISFLTGIFLGVSYQNKAFCNVFINEM